MHEPYADLSRRTARPFGSKVQTDTVAAQEYRLGEPRKTKPVSSSGEPDVVAAIRVALEKSEVVASVVLGGSIPGSGGGHRAVRLGPLPGG
jgi:hypothetical protein